MPLEEYRRKRRFAKTPEPSGKAEPARKVGAKTAERLSFVVQKHAASHLHYDFRLELDGVLLSWAVPRGPSLDPADKRLAVHVEDHPVDYGGFEGTIPKGEYGGGTVMVWDRGWWEPDHGDPREHIAEGHLKFILHGDKLKGRWMLVRTRFHETDAKDQWLLFKERDEQARPRSKFDVTSEDKSALSKRTMEQIAAGDEVWHSDKAAEKVRGVRGEVAEAVERGRGGGGAPERLRLSESPSASRTKTPFAGRSLEPPAPAAPSPGASAAPRLDPGEIPEAKKAPLPDRVEPELATLVDDAPNGEAWVHEVKFDGYRVLLRIKDGKAQTITRRGNDWSTTFPGIVEAASQLDVGSALIDGEVVVLRPDGTTDFQALQNSMKAGKKVPLRFFAFDLLYLDGFDLRHATLLERKAALRSIIPDEHPTLLYSDHFTGDGPEFLKQSCKLKLEGVVSKLALGPYRSGRGRDWLKSKCIQLQEFVIVGWTEPGGSRKGFGALVLGLYDERGRLDHVGRVGTGFTEASIREILAKLEPLEQDKPPVVDPPTGVAARGQIHWVKPELVCEVAFTEWTSDGDIRHPSFKGMRDDKPAREVVREREQPAEKVASEAEEGRAPRKKPTKARSKKIPGPVVAGVQLTNPDRVFYPDVGLTKLDVVRYYEAVADWMLPHVKGRPLTMVRCPEGFTKECWYHKHVETGFPSAIAHVSIEEGGVVREYGYVRDIAGVIALAQMGVLEIHVWGTRADNVEKPDRIVFDLDPDPDLPWETVTQTALLIRSELDRLGLKAFAKTTGGKGLHVVIPIQRRSGWQEVRGFSKAFVDSIVAQGPDVFTANMSKAKRGGKVFIDYVRNTRGATWIAPFSTRARPGATVSVPLGWDEVAKQKKRPEFTVENVPRRLEKLKHDPWADIEKVRQSITAEVRKQLGLG